MKRKGVVERIYDESQTQIFSLSSLTPGSRQKFNFSFEINVKTMKGKPTDINEGQQQQNSFNLPRLNKDNNPLTPTFTFDDSESSQGLNDLKVRKAITYASENEDGVDQILVPKPGSHYCHVCKATYTDYLNHIKTEFHKRKIQQADKEFKIGDLISVFEKSKERQQRRRTVPDADDSFVEKRKRKIRIIDDPSCFTPMPIGISKNISESTYNSTFFFPRTSQRILI